MLSESSRYAQWTRRLRQIDAAGLRRTLKTLQPTGPTTALLDGAEIIVACSNDYLGLAQNTSSTPIRPSLGCGSSRLISGTRPIHRELEQALAAWMGAPCLVFSSGFQANLAVYSTLCEKGQVIASDALNHASIIDGLRLSKATKQVVPHLQPEAIEATVDAIAIEGLFSMDGDVPDLQKYPKHPLLAVDEAHALGCIGPQGRGVAAHQGVRPDIIVGTFGKALGSSGAFVCAPQSFIDLLINQGRSFIYSTAPAEPVLHQTLANLHTLHQHGETLREQLQARTKQFRDGLGSMGLHALGVAHIVPVVLRERTMDIAAKLLEQGVLATGIRYPTVSPGEERIRFTVSAAHTAQQIDQILEALDGAMKQTPE